MADLLIKNTYRIEREIGAGGMGAVYEATHVDLGKCALKQLKQQFAGRPDVLKRFRREARDMFRLKHPHIVRVFDYGVEEGFGAYLVMDFVDGSDLGRVIRENGPLPLDEIIRIGSEVASALDYAHAQGLVHRDIKPGNILIESTTRRALVTDFGIAKHTEQKDDETTDAMTHTEGFIGTSRYSSPEQLRSEDLDARADIYSLGAVLYEMTSGRKYLEGMPENQIIIRVGGFSDWKPDLIYPAGVPGALLELIEACIERDRDKRIARASEIIERLRHCAQATPAAVSATVPGLAARPAPRTVPEEPTQPTAVERFETIRAKLRGETGAALDRIGALGDAARLIGTEAAATQTAAALRARLEEVQRLEEDGAYERAVHALEEIAERAAREHEDAARQLRAAIEAARAELDGSWQEMMGRARGFVGQTHNDRFEQLLAFVDERLREQDWHHAAVGLAEARQVRADAETDARQRAEQAVAAAAAALGEKARQLEDAQALPPEVDPAAVQERIATHLGAGRYSQARAEAEAAAALLDQAIAAWRQRAKDAAAAARSEIDNLLDRVQQLHQETTALEPGATADFDLEEIRRNTRHLLETSGLDAARQLASEALRRLAEERDAIRQRDAEAAMAAREAMHAAASAFDLEAAAAADPDGVEAATASRAQADRAWERGDHRAAAAAYATARQAYEAAAERAERVRQAALEDLRSAAEQARGHPEAVVGDALRVAADLLGSSPSLPAITQALADIRAAIERVAAYRAALEQQQACVAAGSAIRERSQAVLSRRRLRRRLESAQTLAHRAGDSFDSCRWEEASEFYGAAAAALARVNQEALRLEQAPPRSTYRIALAAGGPLLIALVALGIWTIRRPTTEHRPAPEAAAPEAAKPEAVAPPLVLARVEPGDHTISVDEGGSLRFAIDVEGGPPGTAPDTQWWLDDRLVAENVGEWTFNPGYDSARDRPHVVRVRVGRGDQVLTEEWKVAVTDVNRPPVIARTDPVPGRIEKEIGATVRFRADASDPDDDQLRYVWTVDGKPASDEPELLWKVAGDHRIALAISDGKEEEPVTMTWDLAALAPALPPLQLKAEPASLGALRFRTPQEFKLQPPPDAKGLEYDWRLDGKPVGRSPVYLFANDDPALVRPRPVEVAVTVTDERNRKLSKSWTFKVQPPPAPRIAGSTPPSPIEVDAGASVDLRLDAARTVEGQTVSYAFSVDGGREERSSTPSFRFAPRKEEHVVAARAVDNFGQSSERVTWRIRRKEEAAVAAVRPESLPAAVPADGVAAVEAWLEAYRQAFMRKDVTVLQSMMKLGGDKVEALRQQLALQNDLRVAFSNLKIEPLGDGRYRATYERQDSFTNAQTGRPVSPAPVQIRQEFRVVGGRAELDR